MKETSTWSQLTKKFSDSARESAAVEQKHHPGGYEIPVQLYSSRTWHPVGIDVSHHITMQTKMLVSVY